MARMMIGSIRLGSAFSTLPTRVQSRMPRRAAHERASTAALPQWVRPQLTQLVDVAPDGEQWLHEIKFDDYRLHARLAHGAVACP